MSDKDYVSENHRKEMEEYYALYPGDAGRELRGAWEHKFALMRECNAKSDTIRELRAELSRRPVTEAAPGGLSEDEKELITRGEYLGVSKLAERCWNMNAEDAAKLVHDMSSRAHAWLNAHPTPTPAPNREAVQSSDQEAAREAVVEAAKKCVEQHGLCGWKCNWCDLSDALSRLASLPKSGEKI